MKAFEVFVVYVTPFLIIGAAIKLLMKRYAVDLSTEWYIRIAAARATTTPAILVTPGSVKESAAKRRPTPNLPRYC